MLFLGHLARLTAIAAGPQPEKRMNDLRCAGGGSCQTNGREEACLVSGATGPPLLCTPYVSGDLVARIRFAVDDDPPITRIEDVPTCASDDPRPPTSNHSTFAVSIAGAGAGGTPFHIAQTFPTSVFQPLCCQDPASHDPFACTQTFKQLTEWELPTADWIAFQTIPEPLAGMLRRATNIDPTATATPVVLCATEIGVEVQNQTNASPTVRRLCVRYRFLQGSGGGPGVAGDPADTDCFGSPPDCGLATCGDGVLDPGEECDPGDDPSGTCCSFDCHLLAAGTVCRPATGSCDAPERCSVAPRTCPPDVPQPDGSTCENACPGKGVCQDGSCAEGADQSCDDGDPCTADSCDATQGCQHTAATGFEAVQCLLAGTNEAGACAGHLSSGLAGGLERALQLLSDAAGASKPRRRKALLAGSAGVLQRIAGRVGKARGLPDECRTALATNVAEALRRIRTLKATL